jgi:hypothetical protein
MTTYAIGFNIVPEDGEWPSAYQVRLALQKLIDDMGDLEVEQAIWEVEE